MEKHMKKPIFLTFEGIDSCGKTTQVNLLKEYFENNNLKVLFLKEPSGTKLGTEIRNLLLNKKDLNIKTHAELLLFNAARAELCQDIIAPALENETYDVILCDRFYDSTLAYQCYANDKLIDIKFAKSVINFATMGIEPNITFYLQISPELAEQRKTKMNQEKGTTLDRIEKKGKQYQQKVAKGFDKLAKADKKRFRIIDASQNQNEVFNQIITEIKKRL